MTKTKIRNELSILKMHLDQLHNWMLQTQDMVHNIEESLFDLEDGKLTSDEFNFDKYMKDISIRYFKIQETLCLH